MYDRILAPLKGDSSDEQVVAHAGAGQVRLTLARDGEQVVLTVSDDGVGFDAQTPPARGEQTHFGLRLLSELAQECGGRLQLTSSPGHGTTFCFRLPTT